MAVNSTRSMVASLHEGSTDGKYRKVTPDREVVPNSGAELTLANRESLHPWYNYGYPTQQQPMGRMVNPGT